MTSKKLNEVIAAFFTLFFMSILAYGLVALTCGKLELKHIHNDWFNYFALTHNKEIAKSLFDTALLAFSVGALGLIIPLYFTRKNLQTERLEQNIWSIASLNSAPTGSALYFFFEDWKMNSRLWVLQIFLAVSTLMGWIIFPDVKIFGYIIAAMVFKIVTRLTLSFGVVGFLKMQGLVPAECRLWSGFDPRVWYKVAFNKYADPFATAAMSAVIGIDLLGMGYAFLHVPMISDPVFTIGSFYLSLFALRGYKATGKWILLCWTILNLCLYTVDGLINCYITFVF